MEAAHQRPSTPVHHMRVKMGAEGEYFWEKTRLKVGELGNASPGQTLSPESSQESTDIERAASSNCTETEVHKGNIMRKMKPQRAP